MKKAAKSSGLQLRKETLQELTSDDLRRVAGATGCCGTVNCMR